MYPKAVGKITGDPYDQNRRMKTYYSRKDYTEKLRRIKYYDQDLFILVINKSKVLVKYPELWCFR